MSHSPDCGIDTAAYVLGALDASEVTGFERHLASCSVCQAEVESLSQTVRVLPLTAPQYPASRDLRKRVMRAARADAQTRPQNAAGRDTTARFGVGRGTVPRYAPARGYRPGLVSAAVALVLVVVVVVVGIAADGSSSHTSGGGARVISASTGSAEVIVRNESGELIVHKLAHLSDGQVYEVWLERAGGTPQPTSTLFKPEANGQGDVTIAGDLKGYDKILVTREPAGGTARPTHQPVVAVDLS